MSGLVREVDIQQDKYKSLPMGALLTQREAKAVCAVIRRDGI